MTTVYRDFNADELWREYDIEATVPNLDPYRLKNEALTAEMKDQLPCQTDLAYGTDPAEALDIYAAQNSAGLSPVFVFIHGGYWRLGSKNSSGFMAQNLTQQGIAVAPLDYGLAPAVTVDEIVRQVRSAVSWLYHHGEDHGIDRDRIYVSGSSAGAHLSAMIMAPGWQQGFDVPENLVKGAVLFSGLFDLEPLRHCEPNSWLNLDEASARRNSPIYTLPREGIPLTIAYGSVETAEFKRQSVAYGEAWQQHGFSCSVHEMAGLNHFNVTSEMTDPKSMLTKQILNTMSIA